MSTPEPLRRDLLIESYARYGAPPERWLVGGEFERAVVRPDGAPISYDEAGGIRSILEDLAAGDSSWSPYHEAGHLIALLRPDGASITLEPGGQVELSGAPHRSLAALAAEVRENRKHLLALSAGQPHRWIAAGLTPYAPIDSVHWMPKGRYRVMREYLPQHGDLAHAMMKGTCSVQANFDYADEADCADKVRLCAGVAPLTTAIFSNSPLLAGQDTGYLSYRGHIWTRTDPARTGFPPGLRDDYSHERWVDYLLDVPMMFYKRGADWAPAHGCTFRTFMNQGIDGQRATWSDWELHQTSVFPEVRVKRTIEVRGADCVDIDLSIAFCAFFSGLLYDRGALEQGLALASALGSTGSREAHFDAACRSGMAGLAGGRSLGVWAQELAAIAAGGLGRWAPDALPMLDPLLARIEAQRSPGLDLLDAWRRDPSPAHVLAACAY